jgi:glycerate-2-kinase
MLRREGTKLIIDGPEYEPINSPRRGPVVYDMGVDIDRVFFFGIGKGILRVAKALQDVLGNYLAGGCAIVKYGDEEELDSRIETFQGGHPVPDENCVKGCVRLMEMAAELKLTSRDLVFTAIGNGVGSLLTLPVEGIPLEAIKNLVALMQIEKGVPTAQLSIVRNQVDQLKGGRITRLFMAAKMIHLLAIDCNYGNTGIVGYDGLMKANVWIHTMPDVGSPEMAVGILKNWNAWDRVDESIRDYLMSASPNGGVLRYPEFEAMDCRIYGIMPDKLGPLPAAMKRARELGYSAHLINRGHELEASVMGRFFGLLGRCVTDEGQPFSAPCALFFTGEMLVTVGKDGGIGGRDQECALSSAVIIKNQKRIVIGCVDTDGTDGPGGVFDDKAAALGIKALSGGIVDGYTVQEADTKGLNVGAALKSHATSLPLWKLDSGIWATQNISVQDLVVVLVMGES